MRGCRVCSLGWRRAAWLLLGSALLAACAPLRQPVEAPTSLPKPLEQFRLEGRISVKSGEQSFSGGIRWQHDGLHDEVLLTTPMGQGIARLQREPDRVRLITAEGREYMANSGEALLVQVLGVKFPVEGMLHWVIGLPRPQTGYALGWDEAGRVTRLEQDGWRIEYARHQSQAGRWLPGRIFARRDEDLEFRLVVDRWQLPQVTHPSASAP